MTKAKGDANNWHIEVSPKRAGDFGFMSFSSYKYTDKEAELLANEIIDNIGRHVDGVAGCSMVYDGWLCGDCGDSFDSHKEAEACSHE